MVFWKVVKSFWWLTVFDTIYAVSGCVA